MKRSTTATRRPSQLTKSSFVNGIRCHKYLYLDAHRKDLKAPITPEEQARFDEGHQVGELAKELYPGGITIEHGPKALQNTKDAISAGALTIYEATFFSNDVYVRIDILHRKNKNAPWEIIEVKSSTERKPYHKFDIGIQTWVFLQLGYPYKKSVLMHLNPDCLNPKASELFIDEDVTDWIEEFLDEAPTLSKEMIRVLNSKKIPEVALGSQCTSPWECPFYDYCHKKIPESSVLNLYNVRNRYTFLNKGIVTLEDKRLKGEFNPVAQRQLRVQRSRGKKPEIDAKGIDKTLASWVFPLFFFDFETIQFALPPFRNVRPYQKLPIQFSCHKQIERGEEAESFFYLHESASDPRKLLIEEMVRVLGTKGTILCAYDKFEKDRIKEMARDFPQFSSKLLKIHDRIQDPQTVFRDHVYFSEFNGSFSIKVLAPVILGKKYDYSALEISSGGLVQGNYLKMIHPDTPTKQKTELKRQLLTYCERDTLVLVKLVEWLYKTSTAK